MINHVRTSVVMAVSLGIMLGVPIGNAKATDPANTGNQNSGGGYAKRGNCSGCDPTRLQTKPRKTKPTRQAKHAPPAKPAKNDGPDIPLPEKCKYAMPEEPGSEALKIQCNKAGYPTPHWPTRGDTAPNPQPTPEPKSLGDRLRDAERQLIQNEYDKAHGSGRPSCTNSGTTQGDVNDILSGCQ